MREQKMRNRQRKTWTLNSGGPFTKSNKLSWCWQTRATWLEVSQGHKHSTIPYVKYSFPLVWNSNFVFKMRRFWDNWLQKCRDLEIRVRYHSRSLKVVPFGGSCYFLLVFFSNFVPKMHRFWHIRLAGIQWSWNPGYGSLKVIENDTIQSGSHDFLLTFHSNHRSISHHFRDKRRFPSKIANFSHLSICIAPAEGVPLGIWYRRRGRKKLEWWGYRSVEKVIR